MTKREWKLPGMPAVVSVLIVGSLTHFYALANWIFNHDSLYVQPTGFGAGTSSGRWMLEVLDRLLGKVELNYQLPYLDGLVFLLLLAVSAGFLVDALGIRNRSFAALVGAVFVSFPSVCSTMFFRFATPPYGLAILLAILGAWVLPKHPLAVIPSVLCIAASLGIYQAYLPFSIGLMLLQILRETMVEERTEKDVIISGLRACLSLILGFALYYGLLQFFIHRWRTGLVDYQGINEMGKISLSGIWEAYRSFWNLLRDGYVDLTNSPLLKVLYALLELTTVALAAVAVLRMKKWPMQLLAVAMLLLLPLAINFIQVMCPQSDVYTLMAYPMVLLAILPLYFLEVLGWESRGKRQMATAILSLFCFLNAYNANISYMALQQTDVQTGQFYSTLISQVRMTPGYTKEKTWVFLGEIQDPQMDFIWEDVPHYGGYTSPRWLMQHTLWLHHYAGYDVPLADGEQQASYGALPQVREMPCYPDYGSILVLDDAVIVRFS